MTAAVAGALVLMPLLLLLLLLQRASGRMT
jgi:hypothetical protein